MKTILRKILITFLVLSLPVTAARAPAAGAPSRGLLWKVASPTGVAYLLGSVHAARADIYPLADAVEKAFDASQILLVEVNINQDPQALLGQLLARAAYPPGDSIKNHLPPDLAKRLLAKFTSMGLPPEALERLKAWALAMVLQQMALSEAGFSPDQGIDLHFMKRAQAVQKPVVELESVEEQLALLDGLSDDEQATFVASTLEGSNALADNLEKLVSAWKRGDAATLEKYIQEEEAAAKNGSLQKKLLDDRNDNMAAQIDQYLGSDRTVFVVVGAAHLLGPKGLVKILGRKYAVQRL